jgi:hypothetical protein
VVIFNISTRRTAYADALGYYFASEMEMLFLTAYRKFKSLKNVEFGD